MSPLDGKVAIVTGASRGIGFWPALAAGCALNTALYLAMSVMLARFGYRL